MVFGDTSGLGVTCLGDEQLHVRQVVMKSIYLQKSVRHDTIKQTARADEHSHCICQRCPKSPSQRGVRLGQNHKPHCNMHKCCSPQIYSFWNYIDLYTISITGMQFCLFSAAGKLLAVTIICFSAFSLNVLALQLERAAVLNNSKARANVSAVIYL